MPGSVNAYLQDTVKVKVLVTQLWPTRLLCMRFPRQEYLSGLPFPYSGDILDPGIKTGSPALRADSLPTEPPGNSVTLGKIFC